MPWAFRVLLWALTQDCQRKRMQLESAQGLLSAI